MKIGSLFSGYGGLEQGVEAAFGAETAWVSDIDPGACKILAYRYPNLPNHGDITKIDWQAVEPVDILCGGFPCQDVSHAGKRAGMRPDTRSGLWSQMAYAVSILRPRYVVAENVRGLLSAQADSSLEPCPWCVGGSGDGEPDLRALGCVLGDLAELGYDAQWLGLRASDVGAPHGRFRVFVVATDTRRSDWRREDPAGSASGRLNLASGGRDEGAGSPFVGSGNLAAAHADRLGRERSRSARNGWQGSANGDLLTADADQPGREGCESAWGRDLPARSVAADTEGDGREERRAEQLGATQSGVDFDRSAAAVDSDSAGRSQLGRIERVERDSDGRRGADVAWGNYEPAIRRWERTTGRVAPAPTETSAKGSQRLSPAFVEWMMGLPDGWVTDVPDLNRNAQLKALGNGVVPQQAYAALTQMLNAERVAA
jgi:DNA (cytosine-5)-methyltransferase 1